MFRTIKLSSCVVASLSNAFLAFGLYHVHALADVTEGGVLGLTLLLEYWFGISPAFSGFFINSLCFLLGWKLFGKEFIIYSGIAVISFSVAYRIYEQFDPFWPQLYEMPLLAALLGAVFVGLGAGLCVRIGGASGGDDALAMSLAHLLHVRIERIYLVSDVLILGLSASYIPLRRLGCSLLTVILSGQIIGLVQRARLPRRKANE